MSGAPRISPRDKRLCVRCRVIKEKAEYYNYRRICKQCILADQKFKRGTARPDGINDLLQKWSRA